MLSLLFASNLLLFVSIVEADDFVEASFNVSCLYIKGNAVNDDDVELDEFDNDEDSGGEGDDNKFSRFIEAVKFWLLLLVAVLNCVAAMILQKKNNK